MMMNVVLSSQSTPSTTPSPDPMDFSVAAGSQTRYFVMYVIALALGAICAAFAAWFTVQLYRATNKYNDLVQTEAKVRIEEARRGAEEARMQAANALRDAGVANEAASKADESAAKANERAQNLERDNIQLRTDLEAATAESRTKQTELAMEQRKLAAEQRKTAEAQEQAAIAQLALRKHLEEVAARQADRTLSKGFRNVYEMARGDVWTAIIRYKAGDDEAFRFARQIAQSMRTSGWAINEEPSPISKDATIDPIMASFAPAIRPGITIIPPTNTYRTYREKWAQILEEDFTANGFTPLIAYGETSHLIIIVGSKGERSPF